MLTGSLGTPSSRQSFTPNDDSISSENLKARPVQYWIRRCSRSHRHRQSTLPSHSSIIVHQAQGRLSQPLLLVLVTQSYHQATLCNPNSRRSNLDWFTPAQVSRSQLQNQRHNDGSCRKEKSADSTVRKDQRDHNLSSSKNDLQQQKTQSSKHWVIGIAQPSYNTSAP